MKRIGRWLIIGFCGWHMVAILASSIPPEAKDQASILLRDGVNRITQPYLLWTGQWQMWNLFSPNPSNWIGELTVEAYLENGWEPISKFNSRDISIWRKADRIKLVENVSNIDGTPDELRIRFLAVECAKAGIKTPVPVRILLHSSLLKEDGSMPDDTEWYDSTLYQDFCPSA